MASHKPKNSEVDAYVFIKEQLKIADWDVRNPARHPTGQVYTQSECLSDPEIKRYLGLQKPENIVKITETVYWVIEAKREHAQLEQAISEAEGYAREINRSKQIKALFVSGVAGNENDSYLTRTRFLANGRFKTIKINDREVTSLITPGIAKMVMEEGPDIKDLPIDEKLFLSTAERINQILHLGAINKSYRARVMAALLLSLVDETPPNIDAKPKVLINDINARAKNVLENQDKSEFYRYIEITLPATEDNHFKFKRAIVQTIQELNNLNIRSAMNSGADVLGKFYEVFLKYGNGAKEIGIVLTPRHIAQFAVDVVGVTNQDVLYDPTCGTGGFLVSAFDYVKRASNESQVNRFKKNNLFGIDQDPEVVALAIVNMIFRGDGKNNIVEGNCFQKNLIRVTRGNTTTAVYSNEPPKEDEFAVTKVLMNPPFALKSSDEKEYKFIERALSQMQDGGILFSVLPYSAMVKPGSYQLWRKERLLKNNTLLCVLTFPQDLFYPVGVHTVGIFVKKGIPHPARQNVLWVRALNDGLLKSKGKRLPNPKASNDYTVIRDTVKAFLSNPSLPVENADRFQKACPIDLADPILELVPENYLDQAPPTDEEITESVEHMIRESIAFLIRTRKEDETRSNAN